ncbi:MAG: hypothetical protein JOZ10_11085 [Acidobacteria bacterium]|nr:hypothetical protein [Acidobacteriota bacterium]MBV9146424.1 hypothetical protein [Acidobacteriota bacterium]
MPGIIVVCEIGDLSIADGAAKVASAIGGNLTHSLPRTVLAWIWGRMTLRQR